MPSTTYCGRGSYLTYGKEFVKFVKKLSFRASTSANTVYSTELLGSNNAFIIVSKVQQSTHVGEHRKKRATTTYTIQITGDSRRWKDMIYEACTGDEVLNFLLVLRIVRHILSWDVRAIMMGESLVLGQHFLSVFVGANNRRLAVEQIDLLKGQTPGLCDKEERKEEARKACCTPE